MKNDSNHFRGHLYAYIFLALLVMVHAVAGVGQPTAASPNASARELVVRALVAVGHRHDLHSIKSMQVLGNTVQYDLVENDHPGAPFYFSVAHVTITDDFPGELTLVETTPAPFFDAPAFSAFAQPSRTLQTHALRQTIIDADSKQQVLPPANALPAWEAQNPVRVLLLAEKATDLVREADAVRHAARQYVLSFSIGRYGVRLFIDCLSELPSAVEATVAFHSKTSPDVALNAWGDIVDRTEYMDWALVDGLWYPFQWDTFRNGDLLRSLAITSAHLDASMLIVDGFTINSQLSKQAAAVEVGDIDDLPLGQAVSGAPAPNRPIEEIAPGIVQIPNSWYVTLIRQRDGIVVLDAPISAGYSKRILEEAERRFPGLPVKAVVLSTGFFWHIAGVREYAARGIPIYVRDRNAETLRRILTAPHTLFPDDLARHPKEAVLRIVANRTVIGSGPNSIVLMPIWRATQPMIMTYVPGAKLLHVGEMIQPFGPNGSFLYPQALVELRDSVREAGITVDRVIGMHLSPEPWSRLNEALRSFGE